MSPAARPISTTTCSRACCISRCCAARTHHARIRRIDTTAAERMPGVRRIIRGADVPDNLNTLLSLLNFGKDDEPCSPPTRSRYKGEPVVAIVAESERQAREACRGAGRLRAAAGRARRRGGAQARRAGRQRDLPKNMFVYHGRYDHQKLRFGDVERGFRRPTTFSRGDTRCRRSSRRRSRRAAP